MLHNRKDLSISLLVLAVIWMVAAVLLPNGALRGIVTVPFLLFIPGYSIVRIVVRTEPLDLHGIVLSTGTSLALIVLSGLFLNAVDALSLHGWVLVLGFLTIAAATVDLFGPDSRRMMWTQPTLGLAAVPSSRWVMGIVSLAAVTAALCIARAGAESQREYSYTQFWMVPDGSTGNLPTLGIRNEEKADATYAIELVIDGAVVSRRSGLSVGAGQTWSGLVPLNGPLKRADRIEAWLFKADAPNNVYRKVWISSPPKPSTPQE